MTSNRAAVNPLPTGEQRRDVCCPSTEIGAEQGCPSREQRPDCWGSSQATEYRNVRILKSSLEQVGDVRPARKATITGRASAKSSQRPKGGLRKQARGGGLDRPKVSKMDTVGNVQAGLEVLVEIVLSEVLPEFSMDFR